MSKQVLNLIHKGLKEALAVAKSETASTKIVGNTAPAMLASREEAFRIKYARARARGTHGSSVGL